VRSVIESGEIAAKKGLTIGAGTQRRSDNAFRELVARIHAGEIGDIRSGVGRWLLGELWFIAPEDGWTDMEKQLRNWNYYCWLSGDIFVEQFIHSIDLMNWVMQSPPTKAVGVGGREVRTDPKLYGNAFDHYAIQYEYPNDATVFTLDRQTNGCANYIDDEIIGSKGRASFSYLKTGLTTKDGNRWRFRGERNNPYQQEHNDLVAAIRHGKPINDAKQAAESTLTAIMGREAAYSGQEITWEMALKAKQDFRLEKYEFGPLPVAPVPVPGKYKFV
jgi:predicted dehydrogenase